MRFKFRCALPCRASLKNSYSGSVMSPWNFISSKIPSVIETVFFSVRICFVISRFWKLHPKGWFLNLSANSSLVMECLNVRLGKVGSFFGMVCQHRPSLVGIGPLNFLPGVSASPAPVPAGLQLGAAVGTLSGPCARAAQLPMGRNSPGQPFT